MDSERLARILDLHKEWVAGKEGGVRAYLREADLREANLREADLGEANLSGANLREANLSGASGLLDPTEWLECHFEETPEGIIVYKSFGVYKPSPDYWTIAPGSILSEVVGPCRTDDCACGVNVATLKWCQQQSSRPIWKALIRWPWLATAVVPYNTDGKFRVGKLELLERVKGDDDDGI